MTLVANTFYLLGKDKFAPLCDIPNGCVLPSTKSTTLEMRQN